MSTYVKRYDLLKKSIQDKVSADIRKNKNFLKTKIKSCSDEPTDFHNKEMPKAGSIHICLTVITTDSAFKLLCASVPKRMQTHLKIKK